MSNLLFIAQNIQEITALLNSIAQLLPQVAPIVQQAATLFQKHPAFQAPVVTAPTVDAAA